MYILGPCVHTQDLKGVQDITTCSSGICPLGEKINVCYSLKIM